MVDGVDGFMMFWGLIKLLICYDLLVIFGTFGILQNSWP